ncbi:MAG: hypothetical protein EB117_09215 [Betaproteobacteria bacterium]|nr:hypothetical protein [Betaproteobacteria bacterium]
MPTSFPSSLDNFVNPLGTDDVSVVDHAGQHSNVNDAVEALEAKVGVNGSAVTSSHDYKIAQLDANKVPYTGATNDVDMGVYSVNAESFLVTGAAGAGHIHLKHQSVDATATGSSTAIFADVNGDFKYKNAGNYYTTFATSANTANRTYTFPNVSGTVAVGLGNVTNDAQTKASVVPNTLPSAGQILVGNAGGTAYGPVTVTGSGATISMSSTGAVTISAIANASLSNSSITIAGTATSLGGSITQDTITGLSTTGLIKRSGANTLAIATAGTDYLNFSGLQKITVSTTQPTSPATGDLWVDTN